MIFSARVDDCEVLLDDEMTDQRPTPEAASEYLHRAVSEVLTLYASSIHYVEHRNDAAE